MVHTSLLEKLPPIVTTTTLRDVGLSRDQVRRLVEDGQLRRLRRGFCARPDAPLAATRAVRLGGRLTSYSALQASEVWCPPGDERLHVGVRTRAHDLRDPDTGEPLRPRSDVVLHWKCASLPPGAPFRPVVPMGEAIRHLPADLDRGHVVAVIDSALRHQVITRGQLEESFAGVPRLRSALAAADPRAESGTESVARVRLQQARLDPDIQVWIGRRRVDFLLAGRVIVEVDGKEFHDDPAAFERDRRRAAELTAKGFRVLPFSYSQVMYAWPECLAAIRAALWTA